MAGERRVIEAEIGRLANRLIALPHGQKESAIRIHADLARLLLVAFEGIEVDATRRAALHGGIHDRADDVGGFEPPVKCRQQLAGRRQRSRLRGVGTIRGRSEERRGGEEGRSWWAPYP